VETLINNKARLTRVPGFVVQWGDYFFGGFLEVSLFIEVSFFILCFLVVSCFIAGVSVAAKAPNANVDNINTANSFFIVSKLSESIKTIKYSNRLILGMFGLKLLIFVKLIYHTGEFGPNACFLIENNYR
jgi:hypothetical protein